MYNVVESEQFVTLQVAWSSYTAADPKPFTAYYQTEDKTAVSRSSRRALALAVTLQLASAISFIHFYTLGWANLVAPLFLECLKQLLVRLG